MGFHEAKVERPAADRAWVDAFMAAAVDRRLRVLCLFMFVTGARIGECIVLEPQHFNLDEKRAVGPPTKNGDPRVYYLTDELVRELRLLEPRLIHYGRGPSRVFGWANTAGPQKGWKWTCKRAGIPYLTPHEAGRHGFGTETVVRQGVDLATAAKLGGWRDQTVLLRRYAHAKGLDRAAERIFGTENTPFGGTPNAPFNGTPVTHEKQRVG
jgi:integrase